MPLSGKSNITWTRTLQDGSTLTTYDECNLARDSQGRMYRERRGFVPLNSDREPFLKEKQYFDPVARTRTICTVATRRCEISDYYPQTQFDLLPAGLFANGTRYLTREDLGPNVIEGQNVLGSRETITVTSGVIGNSRPVASTREFWYSAKLQTNLVVTRIDPREGKQVVRLLGLSLSEPDPHTFDLPEGFAVYDSRTLAGSQKQ
jgi:hypothetical protein